MAFSCKSAASNTCHYFTENAPFVRYLYAKTAEKRTLKRYAEIPYRPQPCHMVVVVARDRFHLM